MPGGSDYGRGRSAVASHSSTHQSGASDPLKLDDLAPPDDNTDLNVSTTAHGLTPKLPNNASVYLNGVGGYSAPTASVTVHETTHHSGGSDALKLDNLAPPDDNTDLNVSTTAHGLTPKLSNDANTYLNGVGGYTTPTASLTTHATTHHSGGSDPLKLDNLAAPDDNTDLNVSTTAHGLTPKLSNDASTYLNGVGGYTVPAVTSHSESHQSGGGDSIKLDDLAAPDDNTDLNVSTTAHGLTPKLPNDATKYLNGIGGYTVPAVTTHSESHQSGGSDAIKLDDLAAPDDNTDLNVSTTAHGLTPKLPNDATRYLNGIGGYTAPAVTSHSESHQSGGSDAIKLDDLAAPDDNTDLNVSTTAHGLTPKLPNDATRYLNGIGGYTVPAVISHSESHQSGGSDSIKLDDLAAPDDNTDLNVSTTAHGLTPKLPNDSSKFLNGVGGYTAPAVISHSESHQSGGSDSIKLDDLAAPDDNTDLNVSTTAHGLTPKLPNDATKFLNGVGGYTAPAVTSHSESHQNGGSDAIKLDDLAAPDDNTDLNVSTTAHGLTPKLPNDASTYLNGVGAYTTPAVTTHATTHQSGGSDPIKLDNLAAPDDNTDLNVSTTAHGLTPKLSNDASTYLNGVGVYTVPAVTSHSESHQSGGSDAIKLDDLAAPDDNTDLNVSTTAHGLTPKLSNDANTYLNGIGGYTTPSIAAHASTHQSGGSDPIKLDDLSPPDDNTDLDVSINAHGLTPKLSNDASTYLNGVGAYTTPVVTTHSESHQNGGSDAIKLDDLAAPDDNTDLNVSTTAHGLTPKLSNNADTYLNGIGTYTTPTASISPHASTHQSGGSDPIKLDDLAAPDDNTDLDVSTSAHGLAPKLPNDASKFLNGVGGYTTPTADASEPVVYSCRKGSAGTIFKGQPVYISGYNAGGWIEVEKARSFDITSSLPGIGLANGNITNASDGEVVILGTVENFNTSTASVGDVLYIDDFGAAGKLTTTPQSGAVVATQPIAVTTRSDVNSGSVLVIGAGQQSNGYATVTPGPFRIPKAYETSKLDADWLPTIPDQVFNDETVFYFWDDFFGDELQRIWDVNAVGAGSALPQAGEGGVIKIKTGSTLGNNTLVSFDGYDCFYPVRNIDLRFSCYLESADNSIMKVGMYEDDNDYHLFVQDGTGNIFASSSDSGVTASDDTGQRVTSSYRRFRILCELTQVKFYIDNVLEATHNQQSDERLQPYIYIETKAAASYRIYLDYFGFKSNRNY